MGGPRCLLWALTAGLEALALVWLALLILAFWAMPVVVIWALVAG